MPVQKELSGQRRGKIGEVIAIKKLIELGFDVYDNIVDDRGIDLIVRLESKDKISHKDIQVKHSKFYPAHNYYWFGISRQSFKAHKELYFMFILDEHRVFLIPSIVMKILIKDMWTDKKGNWKIVIQQKENWEMLRRKGVGGFNIEKYLNNFSQLGL
jgi:hypothetical protein